jgi:hypothetical protein
LALCRSVFLALLVLLAGIQFGLVVVICFAD